MPMFLEPERENTHKNNLVAPKGHSSEASVFRLPFEGFTKAA